MVNDKLSRQTWSAGRIKRVNIGEKVCGSHAHPFESGANIVTNNFSHFNIMRRAFEFYSPKIECYCFASRRTVRSVCSGSSSIRNV